MKGASMSFRSWYNGKRIPIDPGEPKGLGGLGVIEDTEMEYSRSAKIARAIVRFYGRHWQWIWGISISAASAYAGFLRAFSCKWPIFKPSSRRESVCPDHGKGNKCPGAIGHASPLVMDLLASFRAVSRS
jgi:hypothetical protein